MNDVHSFVSLYYCFIVRSVHQEDLVVNLKQFLTRDSIPEITQTVLNLAEFMEHCEEATVSIYIHVQCIVSVIGTVEQLNDSFRIFMFYCVLIIPTLYKPTVVHVHVQCNSVRFRNKFWETNLAKTGDSGDLDQIWETKVSLTPSRSNSNWYYMYMSFTVC